MTDNRPNNFCTVNPWNNKFWLLKSPMQGKPVLVEEESFILLWLQQTKPPC